MTPRLVSSAWHHLHHHWTRSPRAHILASQSRTATPTRYVQMLLDQEEIPAGWNLLAAVAAWILLAGYLVFPGTFASLRESTALRTAAGGSRVGTAVYSTVEHVPLLGLAATCCALGLVGSAGLWWRWRGNFIWLCRHLFLPILINSATGLLNTVINVYTARGGSWSVTATVTGSVTAACAVVSAVSYGAYRLRLRAIEAEHAAVERADTVADDAPGAPGPKRSEE